MSKLDQATAPSGAGLREEPVEVSATEAARAPASDGAELPEKTGIERQPPSIAAIKELRQSLLAPVLQSRHKR